MGPCCFFIQSFLSLPLSLSPANSPLRNLFTTFFSLYVRAVFFIQSFLSLPLSLSPAHSPLRNLFTTFFSLYVRAVFLSNLFYLCLCLCLLRIHPLGIYSQHSFPSTH